MDFGRRTYRRLRRSAAGSILAFVALLGVAGAALAAVVVPAAEPPPRLEAADLAERLARTDAPRAATGSFEWENRLVPEGLAGAEGRRTPSPLLTGGRGRFWYSAGEGLRIELQGRTGDALLVTDTRTLWLYDGSRRIAERVALPRGEGNRDGRGAPSRSEIERGLDRLERKAELDGPDPAVEADRPAYTLSLSPRDRGGLVDAVRGAIDAETGLPLRLEVLARGRAEPAASLRVGELELGPVEPSRFRFTPPEGTRVNESELSAQDGGRRHGGEKERATDLDEARERAGFPVVAPDRIGERRLSAIRGARRGVALRYGEGAGAVWVLETAERGQREDEQREERLPDVDLGGARGTVLETPLGSAVVWRARGVRHVALASRPARELVAAARAVVEDAE